jgi:hypothetical protein
MIGLKPQVAEVEATSGEAVLEPWQQRVVTEKAELNEKIGNLAAFLASETFGELDEAERARLTRQLELMTQYRSVLTERIAAWVSEVVNVPEVAE